MGLKVVRTWPHLGEGPHGGGYRTHEKVALRDQRRRKRDAEVRGLRHLCKEENTGQGAGPRGLLGRRT